MLRFTSSVVTALLVVATAAAQNPSVVINVDVQANRHPISPLIYGVNLFESPDTATIALVANSLAIQHDWVATTISTFNGSANGGVKYYILDNEHDLWADTHHDAVATAPHYDADTSAMLNYASMIKTQDAGALVVG